MAITKEQRAILNDCYTPSAPAVLNYKSRTEIDDEFSDILFEKGLQIIVYGATGVGKTSLILSQLEHLEEQYLYFPLDATISPENFCAKIMENLGFKKITEQRLGKEKELTAEVSIKGMVWGLFSLGGRTGGKNKDIDEKIEIPYYSDADIDSVVSALVTLNCKLIFDDLEKAVEELKLPLSHLAKKMSDATARNNTTAKVIFAGITQEVSTLLNVDSSLRDRLAEQHIKLLEPEEIEEILVSGWKKLKLSYDNNIVEYVTEICCGFARYSHWIGKYAAISTLKRDATLIENQDIQFAINMILEKYSNSYNDAFTKATSHKTGKRLREKVLFAIASRPEIDVNFNEIIRICSQLYGQELKENQLSGPIGELKTEARGSILESGKNGPTHRFRDLMMKPYIRIIMKKNEINI